MSKYYKNFILCGEVDYFCLLCQEWFQRLPDLEKHIRWEQHRKNIKNQAYVPKYRKNRIYKIGDTFYCEVCNYITPKTNETSLQSHINDDDHKAKLNGRVDQLTSNVVRHKSGVVIINNTIFLNNHQWHGIHKDMCIICQVEVNDEEIEKHILRDDHIKKLIKTEIKYITFEKQSRKIDNNKGFCFICEKIVENKDLEDHWRDGEHVSSGTKILTRILAYIHIDAAGKAVCHICHESVDKNDRNEIMKHRIKHIDVLNCDSDLNSCYSADESETDNFFIPIDHGKRRSIVAKYGRANYIKLIPGGAKGYCTLCNVYMSAGFQMFKEHIAGSRHQGHMEIKGLIDTKNTIKRGAYVAMNLNEHFKSWSFTPSTRTIWVNKESGIDIFSFILIYTIQGNVHYKKTKCYACDEVFPQNENRRHCLSMKHENNLLMSKILMTLPGEFIRELQTNMYHCGFCNQVFPYSNNLKKHIRSIKHCLARESSRVQANSIPANLWYNSKASYFANSSALYREVLFKFNVFNNLEI